MNAAQEEEQKSLRVHTFGLSPRPGGLLRNFEFRKYKLVDLARCLFAVEARLHFSQNSNTVSLSEQHFFKLALNMKVTSGNGLSCGLSWTKFCLDT